MSDQPHLSTDDSSHTPGPWLLNADAARHESDFYGTPAERGNPEVYTSIQFGNVRLTGFIRPADARLIVSAPDLLAILKELVASDLAPYPPYEEGKAAQDAWSARRAKARVDAMDVIAKAEGTDLCEDCNERPITGLDAKCDACRENANERLYDQYMEEPPFRGAEHAAFVERELAEARKLK